MKLTDLTIKQVHEKLYKKEISTKELLESVINAVKEDDKREDKIYSYIELFESDAYNQAEKAQDRINKGETLPLLGIPVSIKDNILYKGHLMTASSKMLEGYVATYTAPVVERLIAAGAIIVGRTNMDEYAMGGTTETSIYGVTRNPCNREYVPGGSSGGSAASVAGNFSFGSLGSDTGGSVRQPASFCGVVGVKPTYGRVPREGCIAMASSLDQVGTFGKDVHDAALMTKVVSGYNKKESTTLNIPVDNYNEANEKDISGIKIGLPIEYFESSLISADVRKNIEQSIKNLEKNGAKIVNISLPNSRYGSMVYTAVMCLEVASNMGRFDGIRYGFHPKGDFNLEEYYIEARSKSFDFEAKARIIFGSLLAGNKCFETHYKHALKVRTLMQADFENAFKEVEAIISPTTPVTASLLGSRDQTETELNFLADSYTSNINLVGLPAMSVPCGVDGNNMPVGLQIITNKFEENTMFSVAYAHERLFNS